MKGNNDKTELKQRIFNSYHCKECGEIPLLHFSLLYFDIICPNHKILNVPPNQFDNFIIFDNECSICSKHFNDNDKDSIYCCECKLFYCNNCKKKHSIKSHFIVNASEKNSLCKLHHKKYDKFCFNCKLNLCELCENHKNKNHYIELIKDIYPLDEDVKYFNEKVKKFNESSQEILNLLSKKEKEIKEEEEREKMKEEKNNFTTEKKEGCNEIDIDNDFENFFDDDDEMEINKNPVKMLEKLQKKIEAVNLRKKCIEIKNLLVNSFSKQISNYIYINNINNIIRCTVIGDIPLNYNELVIKHINFDAIKDDINNIKNKIVIKTLETNYTCIWCMKKLNDIQINENQKLSLIALGNSNNEIILINLLNFKVHQIIEKHDKTVYSLDQYKDDPTYLFSSSEDETINIYELDNNYKYILIQKLKKKEEKNGSEINKVIALSNKLLVSSDHRSITIWKSNNKEKEKLYYEDYYEIVINKDTCQLLEVNPSLFVATQYNSSSFQVYKNDGKTFPLIGELKDVGTHGYSSNGLARINDKLVCSASKQKVFYVICVEPLQIVQKIYNNFTEITYKADETEELNETNTNEII
jgi:WD40 repeat protein